MRRDPSSKPILKGFLRSIIALFIALTAMPALAQPGRMGGGGWQDMYDPAVSTRDLERYARFLKMGDDQTEAAKALLEGYQAEFEVHAREMRETTDAAREEMRETRDFTIMQDLQPKLEAFREKSKKMEQAFLSDVKALLTEDQSAQWPRVERMRRRDTTLRRGFLSGEAVDVSRLIEELNPSDELKQAVAGALEQYETEVDKALIERNAIYEEAMGQGMTMWRSGNMEAMQEMFAKGREAGIKVRDINRKFARQVEGLLPEDKRDDFQEKFRERSFPRVYRPTMALLSIEAAEKFDDLNEQQKQQVEELARGYRQQAGELNSKWSKAIEETELTTTMMELFSGGSNNPAAREARTARRELDSKTLDRLKALLTEEQAARLPERRRGENDDEDRERGSR